jgi:uncharacterized membrane protein YfcA
MIDTIWIYPVLFIAGLAAGAIDSIAGGGGLITLPALLGLGFPPHLALGTNKFQASFGSFTASYYYTKHKLVNFRETFLGILFTLLGTVAGTTCVQLISKNFLNYFIPILLICVIIYTIFTPKLGEINKQARFNKNVFFILFGLLLGFYDGFFGPGVGSLWALAFVVGLGFNFTKATGFTKVMNFTSNIVSLFIFAISGNVVLFAGISMAAGQILGARIGSGLVIKRGAKFIRPVFIVIVILTTLKLIYDRLF